MIWCKNIKLQKNRMLMLQNHLSIIITTSPIKSHPCTQVLDDSIDSILKQPSLQKVQIYIVCDGAKVTEQNKYKSGVITQETMDNYEEYKKRIKLKYGHRGNFAIIERENRCGFAENIKYIMEEHAKTELILIYQHDHVIQKIIDFQQVASVMLKFKQEINYVTFMHKSYRTILSRIISTTEVRDFLIKLIGKEEGFNVAIHGKQFQRDVIQFFNNKFGLPFLPLNFWYDKVHIASRKFYLNVVFNQKGNYDPNRAKFMKTVSFPQDTFGHCMKNTINEQPSKLLQFGAYILWDEQQVFYHQSGRAFITQKQRQQYLKTKSNKNEENKSSSSQGQEDLDFSSFL